MTVRELMTRLIHFPDKATVIGFLDPGNEVRGRLGILIVWEEDEQFHKEFIETPLVPGTRPAPPKKTTGKRKR